MKYTLYLLTVLAGLSANAQTNAPVDLLPLISPTGLPRNTALMPSFELLSTRRLNTPFGNDVNPLAMGGYAWISIETSGQYPILSNVIVCTNHKSHPITLVGVNYFSSSNLCASGDTLYVYYCSNSQNVPTNLTPELNLYLSGNIYTYQPKHWWSGVPAMQWISAPYSFNIGTNPPAATFDLGTVGFVCSGQPPPQ